MTDGHDAVSSVRVLTKSTKYYVLYSFVRSTGGSSMINSRSFYQNGRAIHVMKLPSIAYICNSMHVSNIHTHSSMMILSYN